MQIDRADMKLLIEAGYSGVMRGIDTDMRPVFEAISTWMPQFGAGRIGLALIEMVAGDFPEADRILTEVIASDLEGKAEAQAVLAMCKVLENQQAEARRLAEELRGEGGHAEAFADLLVNGADETTQGPAGLAAESGASSARPGAIGQRTPT
ncbi:HrpB1 family type III secretion system apparatus protein [Paracoccus sanguinis]|uniref:HrpB1 family type III secretion system apparatus protein n=1 Tax=Paracoccus sanguinis TaxID=1545044 RepID=UPI000A68CA5D|nr:hypothetical protein [Paracoccus sanguinis]